MYFKCSNLIGLSTRRAGYIKIFCALFALVAGEASGGPSLPNVILITVDTFRPDHLGHYGYARDTSPHLDALSREGVFFRQAFSSSGWTTPGLISILTSLYAPTHGVDIRGRSLDPEIITLPEVLIRAGYRAPDIFFLTDIPNFSNLGLQPYARRDELIPQGDEIFFHWLEEEAGRDSPFFLYYHYRDLHLPYDPGEPYESMFLPQAFASRFDLLSVLKRFLAAEKMAVVKAHIHLTRGVMDFNAGDRPWVRALYDAEIRRLDEEFFGRLRQSLERTGLLGNTLVVISADHGEELLDRDLIGHVSTFKEGRLYDEIVRIPLIFWYPGQLPGGRVIEEPVQCIDLMPTILDILGLPGPEEMQGQSLLPLIQERQGWVQKPLFFETSGAGYTADEEQYSQRFRALRTERWKLIYSSPDESHALYDLTRDPQEREDVITLYPQIADSLRQRLNEWVLLSQQRPHPRLEETAEVPAGAPATRIPDGIEVFFPQDGDTLGYQGAERAIQLSWTGPAGAEYGVEYQVGEGVYHLEGMITVSGSSPRYGPFQPNVWNSLVLYNPWRFRVYLLDRPERKSAWVTFHLARSQPGMKRDFSLLGLVWQLGGWGHSAAIHAVNLARGLGLVAVDLYLWIGSVRAADLSAYSLLLIITGAIAWPQVRRLGVERCRAWGLAVLYIAFVYSTIPVMPAVWKVLREYTEGSIRFLGILMVAGVAIVIAAQVWRRVRLKSWKPYLALLLIGPVYIVLLDRYALFPSERLHLVEYGFMGGVLFRALRLDVSERTAYMASFLTTLLVGIGDECVQWILPQRFFEVKDVQLNALSGGLGLLLLRFVVESGRRVKREVSICG